MSHALPNHRLHAVDVALQAAGTAIALANLAPPKLRSLADQLIRAASSVPANLAEGHGRVGRARINHHRIAYGSAKEVDVHLQILVAAGAIDGPQADDAIEVFDRTRAMIWRLMNPRP